MTAPDREALGDLIQVVLSATDLEGALAGLAAQLQQLGYEPSMCSLTLLEPTGTFRVRGLWSAMPNAFEPGMVISPKLTPATQRYAQALAEGNTVVIDPLRTDTGLLGDLLYDAHAQSVLVVPVWDPGGGVAGVLGIASARRNAFSFADERLFTAFATGASAALLAKRPPSA